MSWLIEEREGLVEVHFSTLPTVEEINEASERLSHMPNADNRLWVFNAGVNLSPEDVRSIADAANNRDFGPSRVAIFADKNITYGLSRMYQVFRNAPGITLRVFSSKTEAVEWLLTGKDH